MFINARDFRLSILFSNEISNQVQIANSLQPVTLASSTLASKTLTDTYYFETTGMFKFQVWLNFLS
jgi:hypothetical protein